MGRSALALAVLALLVEAPMHPYQMQRLIRERGKDRVVNVRQRTGIYQAIDRLLRGGLIEVAETTREGNRPERTVYRATAEGVEVARDWLRDMLAAPARDFPEFPAALSLLPLLEPDDARAQLERRAADLELQLARSRAEVATFADSLPRLFMVEEEYMTAMKEAELRWVRGLIKDLGTGALRWSEKELRRYAEQHRGEPGMS
jgi:DNA-binding PadR family transcriptional regulator